MLPGAAILTSKSERKVHPAGGLAWWSGDSSLWEIRGWNLASTGKEKPRGGGAHSVGYIKKSEVAQARHRYTKTGATIHVPAGLGGSKKNRT